MRQLNCERIMALNASGSMPSVRQLDYPIAVQNLAYFSTADDRSLVDSEATLAQILRRVQCKCVCGKVT